ncbi:flagellar motor switch protein FliM [Gilliamella apicola]|uniref:flagellar motor switch protein FliM n=1 Tax=Gilliamella apicola TaxID=1196095 RepID=UPI000A358E3E|nr:flagellar motor switch protein FliM [Gilliamella apicola]OTP89948.1 flagellar motor switch protein FliM [Gilliamella apicola]OTP96008.1 flagellar motor switch protein FliM [Gilliamella apicola]OTP96935.1 flagellar motor switch protein FliM [Gilliamella apicola]OTQ03434.1 flagellar motor switch protein FliM [Gilliamella apicola]OTQ04074.1 flagellar motor switch protein FliM [Gilliamella apicola]
MSDKREPITDINDEDDYNPVSESSIVTENNVTDTSVVSLPSGKKADVKPYDLSVKHSFIPERLTALEIINERFARQFRIGLFNLLRRNTDVIASPIETQTFKYFSDISSTYHLNLVHLNPLRGSCLFSFSPELVFIVVDTLFGGDGHTNKVATEGREFTHTEQQIIKRVLSLALTIYQNAWADIYSIETEYIRSEIQSKFTNITTSPDDVVLTSKFKIEIGSFKATFCICIPYAMVEPIKESLIKPPIEQQTYQDDNIWMSSLTSGIKQSTVELVANFTRIQTTVSKLLALKTNDVLVIDKPTNLDVTVGGVPVLKGHYGKVNKQYAIKVEQVINPVIEQLNEGMQND